MFKSLIIIGHLIGVIFLSFLFSDEITITDTFPESLKTGESAIVTTTIVKNDVVGFAKYQINTPRGIVIKPINLNNASFTFKDGKAKFIWMNLPNESTFEIQYEISLEEGKINDELEINSKFSYLVNNERKIHVGPNHLLKIAGEDGVVTNRQSTTSSEINASRKIVSEGDNKYLVEITINKLGVKGFAKIQDIIPDGFVATEVMNSQSIFTQTDAKVKLVWFDIPKNMNLTVSYLLEAPSSYTGDAVINGKFHYMNGSDLKKVDIPSHTISIGGAAIASDHNDDANPTTELHDDLADNTSGNINDNHEVNSNSDNGNITDVTTDVLDTETTKNDVSDTIENNSNTTTLDDINPTKENDNPIDNNRTIVSDNTPDDITNDISDVQNTVDDTSNNITDVATNNTNDHTDNTGDVTSTLDIKTTEDPSADLAENNAVTTPEANDVSTTIIKKDQIIEDNTTVTPEKNTTSNTSVIPDETTKPEVSEQISNTATQSEDELISVATPDMTTSVAEPESTAVAISEYKKDEVLKEESSLTSISNVSGPDKGISYRVQIMAGKKVVGKEYLRRRHKFFSKFTIENHEGWVKYTHGAYGNYKSARDQRNIIRDQYNFNGPFVSAYNDGVRITVQEALMISKQQWYN